MALTNPIQFVQQVRAEVGKITWPTRRETTVTTLMVVAIAALAALFFSLVDISIRFVLEIILNYFRG